MDHSLKRDCLAYQTGVRPGCTPRFVGNIPLHQVVGNVNLLLEDDTVRGLIGIGNGLTGTSYPPIFDLVRKEVLVTHPERDAVVFYLLNHAIGLLSTKVNPYESLGKYMPLVEEYHVQLAMRSVRMFSYLLLICTRESRHERSKGDAPFYKHILNKYGKEISTFRNKIRNSGSQQAVDELRKCALTVPMGKFTEYLVESFEGGSFSGGYGGEAWAEVAKVLNNFVHGIISAEVMMDTAFTLCHNNGPIFNKGMLFKGYNTELIQKILDVQRSGQIPQLVNNGAVHAGFITNVGNVDAILGLCKEAFPDEMNGHVDWKMVEDLGAMGAYTSEKKQAGQVNSILGTEPINICPGVDVMKIKEPSWRVKK